MNLPDGRRLFHIGDVVMLAEGIEKSVPKGKLVKELDYDHDAANAQVAAVHALAQKAPKLTILPAHDRNVWEAFFGKVAGVCAPARTP